MMKKFLFAVLVGGLILSCSKDEKSLGEAELISFKISEDCTCSANFSETILDEDYNIIHTFSDTELKSVDYPISLEPEIAVSAGATVTPSSNEQVTFTSDEDYVNYKITSEDNQVTTDWYALVRDNQLPNSDFDNWYEVQGLNGLNFVDPGKYSESTIWATANMGTSTYSVYGTVPVEENGNTIVKISTGETDVVPITAGTLFIGRFDVEGAIQNPTDPEKATDFGVPFIYRPTGIKFNYQYTSGAQMIQATLRFPDNLFGGFDIEQIEGKDDYKIYAFLEKRTGDKVLEIAYVEIKGSDTEDQLTERIMLFDYSSEEIPTHISLVFTSSANGHLWKGAVGSTLLIDDLKLVYE